MKTDFPLDFYNQMIEELKRLQKEQGVVNDMGGERRSAITKVVSLLMEEIAWYSQRKWYTEEEVREEFGKVHPITDRSVLAWEELGNMLIGEQISYMAESLDLEYNAKVGMWT